MTADNYSDPSGAIPDMQNIVTSYNMTHIPLFR